MSDNNPLLKSDCLATLVKLSFIADERTNKNLRNSGNHCDSVPCFFS